MTYRLVWFEGQPDLDHVVWKRYDSPWGPLVLWVWQNALIRLFREGDTHTRLPFSISNTTFQESDHLDAFFEALRKPTSPSLKAVVIGSQFNLQVWRALVRHGDRTNLTYQELACLAGSSRACRAVGNALSRNPLPLMIPCHRVVARQGQGGFQWGLETKKYLQDHPPSILIE